MKRTFVKISVFAVTFGMVLASCNNEEENGKLQDADNAAIQALVAAKEASLDSTVAAEWNAKVLVAAEEAVAAAKKSGHPVAKPVAKPIAKEEPVAKKEEPKPAPATGLKAKSDASQQSGGGLKAKSDQANQQSGGGLKAHKDAN